MTTEKQKEPTAIENRIFEAALTLFAQKGYAATSIREIVTQADVTNPMVYYYFGSKEGLFHGLIKSLQDHFYKKIMDAISDATSVPHILRLIATEHFTGLRESPTVFRFIYAVLYGPYESFPQHTMIETHAELREVIVEHVDSLLPNRNRDTVREMIELWFGLVSSTSMHCLVEITAHCENADIIFERMCGNDAIENLLTFYLRGVGLEP